MVSCSICLDVFDAQERSPLLAPCGHTVCRSCVTQLQACPFCRAPLPPDRSTLPRNFALLEVIEAEGPNSVGPEEELLRQHGVLPDGGSKGTGPHTSALVLSAGDLQLTAVELGGGGTGRVVLGYYRGREVAVKLLQLSGPPAVREALQREVRLLARVSSVCRHTVRLLGVTVKDGRLALVMPKYPGSLMQHLARQPGGCLPAGRAVLLAVDLLRGLVELHAHGIVMADLKPDNVLLDDAGTPLLCDFGIGRAVTATIGQHLVTSPQGSVNYMAPEQFAVGEADAITPQSDMWAFATTLLHAMTGRPPWSGLNMGQITMQVGVHRRSPELPPGLAPALHSLLGRCLRPDPGDRPSAAAALAALTWELEQRLQEVYGPTALAGAAAAAPVPAARAAPASSHVAPPAYQPQLAAPGSKNKPPPFTQPTAPSAPSPAAPIAPAPAAPGPFIVASAFSFTTRAVPPAAPAAALLATPTAPPSTTGQQPLRSIQTASRAGSGVQAPPGAAAVAPPVALPAAAQPMPTSSQGPILSQLEEARAIAAHARARAQAQEQANGLGADAGARGQARMAAVASPSRAMELYMHLSDPSTMGIVKPAAVVLHLPLIDVDTESRIEVQGSLEVYARLHLGLLLGAAAQLLVPRQFRRYLLRAMTSGGGDGGFIDLTDAQMIGEGIRLRSMMDKGTGEVRPRMLVVVDTRVPKPRTTVVLHSRTGAVRIDDVEVDYTYSSSDLGREAAQAVPANLPMSKVVNFDLLIDDQRRHLPALLGANLVRGGGVCHMRGMDGPNMQLVLRTHNKNFILPAHEMWKVEYLKAAIEEADGIPSNQMRLIYKLKLLDDQFELCYYGIGDGSEVFIR